MPTNPHDFPLWATPSQLLRLNNFHRRQHTHFFPDTFFVIQRANMSDAQTKKFGKGERTIPHHSQKAQKWYPVDDEAQPKKVSSLGGNTTVENAVSCGLEWIETRTKSRHSRCGLLWERQDIRLTTTNNFHAISNNHLKSLRTEKPILRHPTIQQDTAFSAGMV